VTNATARKQDESRARAGNALPLTGTEPVLPQTTGQEKKSFGITLLGVYVFLLISRILDIAPVGFLHLPMIMLLGLSIMAFSLGDWQKAFQSKVTVFFGLFTVWVIVCFPMSSWRGGSVESVISAVEAFGLYLVIVQLVKNTTDWNRVASAFSYSALAAAVLSFFFGRSIDGRIALVSGTLGDPNTFALSLILGLPFWWYKASQSKSLGKVLCVLAMAPILISFGRAGSRAGLLALATMTLAVFLFSEFKQKMAISVLAIVGLVASGAFLPSYIKARYTTIFVQSASAGLDALTREKLNSDIDSSQERQKLLRQSIQMTFAHPLFGVGPGVFRETAWNERKAKQEAAGSMLVSHNTWTQMSSETGIPGFVLFAGTYFSSLLYSLSDFRRLKKINPLLSRASLYTFASLAALGLGIFFLSIGYGFLLAAIFGLAASLRIVRSGVTSAEQGETAAPAPTEPEIRTPEAILAARRRFQPSSAQPERRVRFGRYVGKSQ